MLTKGDKYIKRKANGEPIAVVTIVRTAAKDRKGTPTRAYFKPWATSNTLQWVAANQDPATPAQLEEAERFFKNKQEEETRIHEEKQQEQAKLDADPKWHKARRICGFSDTDGEQGWMKLTLAQLTTIEDWIRKVNVND
jgi:hypothetical protein